MLKGYKTMSFNVPSHPPSAWLSGLLTIKPIHQLFREGHETDPIYQSLSFGCGYYFDNQGFLPY